MLNGLDLFSGIGGITLSTRAVGAILIFICGYLLRLWCEPKPQMYERTIIVEDGKPTYIWVDQTLGDHAISRVERYLAEMHGIKLED